MTRQTANEKLLRLIRNDVSYYPNLTFGQILVKLGVVLVETAVYTHDDSYWTDETDLESADLLARVEERLK